jgi:class 3 adenylate cyclase
MSRHLRLSRRLRPPIYTGDQRGAAMMERLVDHQRQKDAELPEIIQRYHSCVVETIGRHNGLVAHTYGNTAVVCFGYPEAHEDDPERAVRAALPLIAPRQLRFFI